MPANYTGDQTQTRAPSAKPGPEGTPVLALPVDGEAANAASIAQALKVLADFVGFSLAPHATASQWAQAILRFRSAQGHTRFAIDHHGFPMGPILHWQENWLVADSRLGVTPSWPTEVPTNVPGWSWVGGAAGSRFLSSAAGPNQAPYRPVLVIEAGSGALSYSATGRRQTASYSPDEVVAMEWETWLQDPSFNAEYYEGWSGGAAFTPNEAATDSSGQNQYAVFAKVPGDTHWLCRYKPSLGSLISVPTSVVAAPGWVRMRLEWHGANVSDDLTAALRFWINGTLVHTATSGLPLDPGAGGSVGIAPHFSMVNIGGDDSAAANLWINAGMQYAQNLYASDVLL